jgi:hypothetical protein
MLRPPPTQQIAVQMMANPLPFSPPPPLTGEAALRRQREESDRWKKYYEDRERALEEQRKDEVEAAKQERAITGSSIPVR